MSYRYTDGNYSINIFRPLLISQFRVCRRETYRVKLLTYRALLRYSEEFRLIQENITNMPTPLSVLSSHSRILLPLERSLVPRDAIFCLNRFVNYLNSLRRSSKRSTVVTPNVSYGQFFRALRTL